MYSEESLAPLEDHLRTCICDARAEWLRENKAGRDGDHVWTQEVVEAHLNCQLKHGGICNVQVSIITRKPWLSEMTFFRLKRIRNNLWARRDSIADDGQTQLTL
jgi:hypothetical protein